MKGTRVCLSVALVAILALTIVGCGYEPPKPQNQRRAPASEQDWGLVAQFGMVTTAWISDGALADKYRVAQILHQIEQKNRNNAIWFFSSKEHTPRGVPMTDKQMLYWVGLYDTSQRDTFSYIKVTDPSSSPPKTEIVETSIRPGLAE